MTEKRYFKRMWEGEYYIFDSETISENEFDEKVEYEDYQAFADSMQGDEVVNKLNQLNGENKQLKYRLAISEKENFVTALAKENGQLKSIIDKLTLDNTKMKKVLNTTKKENEQLKEEIKDLNDVLARYEEKELEND